MSPIEALNVFVSYAHKDEDFLNRELMPFLKDFVETTPDQFNELVDQGQALGQSAERVAEHLRTYKRLDMIEECSRANNAEETRFRKTGRKSYL